MKLAVAYENGNIYEHFGKCEEFKVYEIEEGKVVNSVIVPSYGAGHEAVANLLKEHDVNTVVCGGIGDGAISALMDAGIEIIAGIKGSVEDVVESFLKGELESKEAVCADNEEGCGGCGGDCESGGCGGGCGGCGGGCHPKQLEGKNSGKIVRVHYRGTYDNGEVFDSSYDRGEPIEFICGTGMMISGFDKAVVDMEVGQELDVHLMPEEAYGAYNENAVITVEIAMLPGSENLEVGRKIVLSNAYGQNFPALVTAKDDVNITFDTNHEMAGKELNFHIELVEVK